VSASTNPVPKLPHGWPFLLLDRVLETDERRGVFLKLVTASDPCVAADGTLPAAFVLEALAQAGGALMAAQTSRDPTPGYLAGVDDFRVSRTIRVGESLRIEVEIVRHFAGATLFRARALVDETVCAQGRFTLALPR
jgi:3-hydroxyacyl-[acyl-carrier-protein] dehydratase